MFHISSHERNANENHRGEGTTHLKYKTVTTTHMPSRSQGNQVRDPYLVRTCDTVVTWRKGMTVSYRIMDVLTRITQILHS